MNLTEMYKRLGGELMSTDDYNVGEVITEEDYEIKFRVDTWNNRLYIVVAQYIPDSSYYIRLKNEFGCVKYIIQEENIELALNDTMEKVEEYFAE